LIGFLDYFGAVEAESRKVVKLFSVLGDGISSFLLEVFLAGIAVKSFRF